MKKDIGKISLKEPAGFRHEEVLDLRDKQSIHCKGLLLHFTKVEEFEMSKIVSTYLKFNVSF